jgi:hypothetical protein
MAAQEIPNGCAEKKITAQKNSNGCAPILERLFILSQTCLKRQGRCVKSSKITYLPLSQLSVEGMNVVKKDF